MSKCQIIACSFPTINGGIGMIDGLIGTVRQAIGERHCITIHSASRLVCIYGYYDTSAGFKPTHPGKRGRRICGYRLRSRDPCRLAWSNGNGGLFRREKVFDRINWFVPSTAVTIILACHGNGLRRAIIRLNAHIKSLSSVICVGVKDFRRARDSLLV